MTGIQLPPECLHTLEASKSPETNDLVMEDPEVARHGRVYKKSNWTLIELQVLQTAKREDQEKQTKADPKEKHKSAAERWQWIEDYCWDQGVERSAQQCRDRWERMSADYKKVRGFEKHLPMGSTSYWQMTIDDRKVKKLPSNFQPEVFNALGEWFVRSRAVDPNDTVIDTCAPSPVHVNNNTCATMPSNAEISSSYEGDSDPPEVPNASKRRKLPPTINVESIAAVIEKSNMAIQKTMLECEERKDRRHREMVEANERLANGYISAMVNIADALRQFATSK